MPLCMRPHKMRDKNPRSYQHHHIVFVYRKLAQSAQMYHYQHQKNQMIAFGRANGGPGNNSDNESDEGEAEEGDYTVYECPGLASVSKFIDLLVVVTWLAGWFDLLLHCLMYNIVHLQ